MTRVKLIVAAVAVTVCAALAGGAAAQQANTTERTFLTFSSAVEMPGVTLEPGTYVFKLADTPTRNVVQVWNEDETKMLGHWLFLQAERPRVTEDTVVMFSETGEGATPAVQYWYFPGERIGKEFIYPSDQAERIAARTGQRVRTDGGFAEPGADVAADAGAVAAAEPAAQDAPAAANPTAPAGSLAGVRQPDADVEVKAEADAAPAPVAEPAPAVVVDAEVDTPAAAAPQVTANEDDARAVGTSGRAQAGEPIADELPRTASPLALSGLIGLLSLLGAAGIRAFRG